MPPFVTTRQVEFSDTDLAGIVHFAEFFRYMESAEHAFLRTLGLSVTMDWEGQKVGFPRVAAACDFAKPAHFEDELAIAVEVRRLGRSSVTYGFTVRRGPDELARGSITTVFCRRTPQGAWEGQEIPPAIREKLAAAVA